MKQKIIKMLSRVKYYLIFSLILSLSNAFAQPYIYYPKLQGNSSLNDIYRINLANGEDNLFIKDVGHVTAMFQNSDQTSLFLDQRGYLNLVRLNNPNKMVKIAEGYESIISIQDAPRSEEHTSELQSH